MDLIRIRRSIAAIGALLAAVSSLWWVTAVHAETTIAVPGMQPTIQAAINAASAGDTVLVSPGTYNENIDFQGKAITVKGGEGASATIIDGGAAGPVANFSTNESRSSVLEGFTLRNGMTIGSKADDGGGVYISHASPSILDNVVIENFGCSGTGIQVDFSSALVQGNTISGNRKTNCSGGDGGGLEVGGAGSAQIIGNTITANESDFGGGIAVFAAGTPTIEDNVIENNTANIEGGGIWVVNQSDAAIVQNIVAGNTSTAGAGLYIFPPYGSRGAWLTNDTVADNNGIGMLVGGFDTNMVISNTLFVAAPGSASVKCDTLYNPGAPTFLTNDLYSGGGGVGYTGPCLAGSSSTGNVSVDPQFVNASAENYHLNTGSPVVNAGTNSASGLPATDLDGYARIVGGVVDLGVYEVQQPLTAPGAVTNLQAHRSKSTIAVSWSAPAYNGGTEITGYRVTQSPGTTQTVGGSTLSVTYGNASRNTTYTFTVVAVNAVGAGPPSTVTAPRV
jgi:nitrous oxidase accessory protein NosD